MKKILTSFIIAVSITCIVIIPRESQAADYSIGMYSYYTWWDPSWRSIFSDVKNDPMLLWGPYLSVTAFEKLSFSALLIQNSFNSSDSLYTAEGSGSSGAYTIDTATTIDRAELDITAGYRFTPRFSMLLGCKFLLYNQRDDGDQNKTVTPATYNLFEENHISQNDSIGAGIGASYSMPIWGNLVFTAANTIVYFNSKFNLISYYESSPGFLEPEDTGYKYISLGDNITGTFSYYVPVLSTTFSLGGRFQVLKHFPDGDAPSLANDYFYGMTLSAILHI